MALFKFDDCVRITYYFPKDGRMVKTSEYITNGDTAEHNYESAMEKPGTEPADVYTGYTTAAGLGCLMEIVGDSYREYLETGLPLYRTYPID